MDAGLNSRESALPERRGSYGLAGALCRGARAGVARDTATHLSKLIISERFSPLSSLRDTHELMRTKNTQEHDHVVRC